MQSMNPAVKAMMSAMGYKAGQGLGLQGQGIKEAIQVEKRSNKLGLGAGGGGGRGHGGGGGDVRAEWAPQPDTGWLMNGGGPMSVEELGAWVPKVGTVPQAITKSKALPDDQVLMGLLQAGVEANRAAARLARREAEARAAAEAARAAAGGVKEEGVKEEEEEEEEARGGLGAHSGLGFAGLGFGAPASQKSPSPPPQQQQGQAAAALAAASAAGTSAPPLGPPPRLCRHLEPCLAPRGAPDASSPHQRGYFKLAALDTAFGAVALMVAATAKATPPLVLDLSHRPTGAAAVGYALERLEQGLGLGADQGVGALLLDTPQAKRLAEGRKGVETWRPPARSVGGGVGGGVGAGVRAERQWGVGSRVKAEEAGGAHGGGAGPGSVVVKHEEGAEAGAEQEEGVKQEEDSERGGLKQEADAEGVKQEEDTVVGQEVKQEEGADGGATQPQQQRQEPPEEGLHRQDTDGDAESLERLGDDVAACVSRLWTPSCVESLAARCGGRATLVLGDLSGLRRLLGRACVERPTEMEHHVAYRRQLLWSCAVALRTLAPGGCLVLRLGHTLTAFSSTLLYVLFRSFERLWLGSTFAACTASAERYVLCCGRLADDGAAAQLLCTALAIAEAEEGGAATLSAGLGTPAVAAAAAAGASAAVGVPSAGTVGAAAGGDEASAQGAAKEGGASGETGASAVACGRLPPGAKALSEVFSLPHVLTHQQFYKYLAERTQV